MPKLPDLWRIVRELDLEAIRREAGRPFQLLVAGGTREDAEQLARLLSGGPASPIHPWVRPADAAEGGAAVSPGMADLAVLATRTPELNAGLARAQGSLHSAKVPAVTVVCGSDRPTDALLRPGENARVAVPALDQHGLATLSPALLAAVPPGVRLALARHLPGLRPAYLSSLIEETAQANAAYAFTAGVAEAVPGLGAPLNLADIVVLTKNQLVMSYRIALAAGKSGDPRGLLGEVIGVIGGGLLFRQGARQLVGLIPVAGIAPKVAMAYAGTWAIGRAVAAWATEGHRLSKDAVRGFYKDAWLAGKRVAAGLASHARTAPRRLRWPRRSKAKAV